MPSIRPNIISYGFLDIRRRCSLKGVKEYAEKLLPHIPELDLDIEVLKLNVQVDHVHMVVAIPPKYAVAGVVQYIKSQLAKALKARFPSLKKVYFSREGIWSRAYYVSCIGLDESEILAYVEHQEKEDGLFVFLIIQSQSGYHPFGRLKSPVFQMIQHL